MEVRLRLPEAEKLELTVLHALPVADTERLLLPVLLMLPVEEALKEALVEADLDLEPELVWDTEVLKLPVAQALLVLLWLAVPEAVKLALPEALRL